MRSLVSTLYIIVFLALFGLGWVIDRYYDSIVGNDNTAPYSGYQAALHLAADHLTTIIDQPTKRAHYIAKQSLSFSLESVQTLPLPPSLTEQRDRGEIITLESNDSISMHLLVPDSQWLLNLELDQIPEEKYQSIQYWLTLLFYAGVAAILLLWLTPLLRGISQLNKAAKHIGQGKLSTRVDNTHGNYLRPLKTQFNAMAGRLERLNENNQLLTQAVSHELRTPLSRMRFGLSMLESRADPEQRQQDFMRIERDMDTMEALITELLRYARLDKAPSLNYQRVEIERLIKDRISLFPQPICEIYFESKSPDLSAHIDPEYFSKVVDNLIQNACRYAKTSIKISCHWSIKHFTLQIEDDGPGIDMDKIDDVFKPFVQLPNADGKNKQGFGLGLAVVERIVKWHGGTIDVSESVALGGAQFIVRWPISINYQLRNSSGKSA